MPDLRWFVASVRSCQERRIAEVLSPSGIEVYVPVQKVKRKWSDRTKVMDRLLIPGLVFIHCDEKTRTEVPKMVYGISYYLMDRTSDVRKPLAVPDRQMEDFIRVVRAYNGESDIDVVYNKIEKGDTVRVIRGPLAGRICECANVQNQYRIIIRLGPVGSLLASISPSDVVKEN